MIADYQGPVGDPAAWPPGWPPRPEWSTTACSLPRWWRRSWSAGAASVERTDVDPSRRLSADARGWPRRSAPLAACGTTLYAAAWSASTSEAAASTRPAGMMVSPARSLASASFLSAPVTSHRSWRARASAG